MKKIIRSFLVLFCFAFLFACKGKQIGGAVPTVEDDARLGPVTTLEDYTYPADLVDCVPGDEECERDECVGDDCDADADPTAPVARPTAPSRPGRPARPVRPERPSRPSEHTIEESVLLDPVVEKAVRATLELSDEEVITAEKLAAIPDSLVITAVDVNGDGTPDKARSLEGLEHCRQLKSLIASEQNITDLTPLARLPKLQVLLLDRTSVSDISPLIRSYEVGSFREGIINSDGRTYKGVINLLNNATPLTYSLTRDANILRARNILVLTDPFVAEEDISEEEDADDSSADVTPSEPAAEIVEKIRVTIRIADFANAGSDAGLKIRFCIPRRGSNGVTWREYCTEYAKLRHGFNRGETYQFDLEARADFWRTDLTLDHLNFFEIGFISKNYREHDTDNAIMIAGVSIHVDTNLTNNTMNDGFQSIYRNPAVYQWLNDERTVPFHRLTDAVVMTKIITGNGSGDPLELWLKDNDDDGYYWDISVNLDMSELFGVGGGFSFGTDEEGVIPATFYYGAWETLTSRPPKFMISKGDDLADDGLTIDQLKIYIFRPCDNSNRGCGDEPIMWVHERNSSFTLDDGDGDSLCYPSSCTFQLMDSTEIIHDSEGNAFGLSDDYLPDMAWRDFFDWPSPF